MIYTIPDPINTKGWNIKTVETEEKPNTLCKDCGLSSWCRYTLWVDGCGYKEFDNGNES